MREVALLYVNSVSKSARSMIDAVGSNARCGSEVLIVNELSITSVERASCRELDANAAAAHVSATSAASGTSHCRCLAGEWVTSFSS